MPNNLSTSENLIVRDSLAEAIQSTELVDTAISFSEEYGCTTAGLVGFRRLLLDHADPEHRETLNDNPNLTRLAVLLYNEGLRLADIDDRFLLHYHFTSQDGVKGIKEDRAIRTVGVPWSIQAKDHFQEWNQNKINFTAFVNRLRRIDNLESTGTFAATKTPPERVKPVGTKFLQVGLETFIRMLDRIQGKSTQVGLEAGNLEYYYEIISPLSLHLFKRTVQSILPGGPDEAKCILNSLSLEDASKYVVLGPKKTQS